MAKKVADRLEKAEEKHKKDLDGDKEKGEPAAHRAKVLGNKAPKLGNKGESSIDFDGKKAKPFGGMNEKAGKAGKKK